MKTTAKIFIWIGMISQFFLVFPIIVGVKALKKIKEELSTTEIKQFAVVTFFFCSPLGGLFMLLMDIAEFDIKTTLYEIANLHYNRLITADEYKRMRDAVIAEYIKSPNDK